MSADMNVGASSGNTSVIVNEWEAEAFLGYIFDEPLNSLRRVNIHDLEKIRRLIRGLGARGVRVSSKPLLVQSIVLNMSGMSFSALHTKGTNDKRSTKKQSNRI